MDYEFFQVMTTEQAQTFLSRFLAEERQRIEETRTQAEQDGVRCDYSMTTLAAVLKWMANRIQTHREPLPQDVPWWIRQAHQEGLTAFDGDSNTLLLRAAYYMGECFARLRGLRWSIGDPEFMEMHMPVVTGFRGDLELPPLVVVENMFARIVGDGRSPQEIDNTLAAWQLNCPGA